MKVFIQNTLVEQHKQVFRTCDGLSGQVDFGKEVSK
jgi:hypothetical protein